MQTSLGTPLVREVIVVIGKNLIEINGSDKPIQLELQKTALQILSIYVCHPVRFLLSHSQLVRERPAFNALINQGFVAAATRVNRFCVSNSKPELVALIKQVEMNWFPR